MTYGIALGGVVQRWLGGRNMNAIHLLIQLRDSLPEGNSSRAVADMLLKKLPEIQDRTIDEIAEICCTNATALSRLARKLDYKNFSEFRSNLQGFYGIPKMSNLNMPYNISSKAPDESVFLTYMKTVVDSVMENYNDEVVTAIAEQMHRSGDICFYTETPPSSALCQLEYNLILDGKDTSFWRYLSEFKRHVSALGPGSLVVFAPGTSYHVSISEHLSVLQEVRKTGAKLLLLVPDTSLLLSQNPDFSLCYTATNTSVDIYFHLFYLGVLTLKYQNLYISARN